MPGVSRPHARQPLDKKGTSAWPYPLSTLPLPLPCRSPRAGQRSTSWTKTLSPARRCEHYLARKGYTIHDTAGGATASLQLLDASSTPLIVLLGLWRPGGWGEEIYEALLTGGCHRASHVYILLWAPAPVAAGVTSPAHVDG